jgi:hypothetical protein
MIYVCISAQAPWANDPYERNIELAAVPSKGDIVALWHAGSEHHFDVVGTTYSAPEIGREPIVCVSTDGHHPDEVRDIFASTDKP